MTKEYLAGLFDGEGNVEITNKFALRIGVSNTFKAVIENIREIYGGSIYVDTPKKQHWKVGYHWRASGAVARQFLSDTYPFLIIKSKQAAIGLQIVPHKRGIKFTKQERQIRENWRKEIQVLNKRGI